MAKTATGRPKAAAGGQARSLDLKAVETRGKRFLSVAPQTYDATERTVEIILSEGSAVERWYGIEVLSTEQSAVTTTRLNSSGIPFLDSHMTDGMGAVIGRIVDVWFAEGRILGRAKFTETDAGKMAEGMVARREMAGVSIGYRVDAWTITDADGTVIDPDKTILNLDDKLTFTATRWELLEVSLVSVPADPAAMVRSGDVATDQDLRASPMGKGAKEITVTHGDCSVTYRYGADAPSERAWPENQKGNRMPKPSTKAARADDDVKDDGSTTPKDSSARGKRTKRDDAADDAKDDDKDDDTRDAPAVDDDGYYVDGEGNYVDADGEPSDDPVMAPMDDDQDRDMDGEDDDEGDRKERGKRSVPAKRSAASAKALNRKDTAELVRIGDQARGLKIDLDVAGAIERNLKPDALRKIMFDKLAARHRPNLREHDVLRDVQLEPDAPAGRERGVVGAPRQPGRHGGRHQREQPRRRPRRAARNALAVQVAPERPAPDHPDRPGAGNLRRPDRLDDHPAAVLGGQPVLGQAAVDLGRQHHRRQLVPHGRPGPGAVLRLRLPERLHRAARAHLRALRHPGRPGLPGARLRLRRDRLPRRLPQPRRPADLLIPRPSASLDQGRPEQGRPPFP